MGFRYSANMSKSKLRKTFCYITTIGSYSPNKITTTLVILHIFYKTESFIKTSSLLYLPLE